MYYEVVRNEVSNKCLICSKDVFDGLLLSNGTKCHRECIDTLKNKTKIIQAHVDTLLNQRYILNNKLNNLNSFFSTLKGMFGNSHKNEIQSVENQIQDLDKIIRENKQSLEETKESVNKMIVNIYDYYPNYPPDWDKRRELIIQRDGNFCSSCGIRKNLHLHHITALSKGGSNSLSNLTLLCEACHSKEHGNRKFRSVYLDSKNAYSSRLETIELALKQNKSIEFQYKKPSDTKFQKRSIKPHKIVTVDHISDNESTLCVTGFCNKRQENRTFALKRMQGLKII